MESPYEMTLVDLTDEGWVIYFGMVKAILTVVVGVLYFAALAVTLVANATYHGCLRLRDAVDGWAPVRPKIFEVSR